jgi:hypothetical protein
MNKFSVGAHGSSCHLYCGPWEGTEGSLSTPSRLYPGPIIYCRRGQSNTCTKAMEGKSKK